jgi:putative ABC transport system substrate-binding protein
MCRLHFVLTQENSRLTFKLSGYLPIQLVTLYYGDKAMSTEKMCWYKKLCCQRTFRFLPCCFLLFFLVVLLSLSGFREAAADGRSIKKIGVIVYGAPFLKSFNGFRAGLEAAGYREGVEVEYSVHNINKHRESVQALVREFIQHDYDLIFAVTTPVVQAVKKATRGRGIPVLFTTVADPVESRIVDSLEKPGGNITGVSHIAFPLMMKRLLLFIEAFPFCRRIGFFFNPEERFMKNQLEQFFKLVSTETQVEMVKIPVRDCQEMETACRQLSKADVDGLFMVPDPLPMAMFGDLLSCSRREKLPLMVIDNTLLSKGGVMGYSPDVYDVGFQVASMADRIFHGAAAGDLPVENPDQIKLVVSLKEARALGLFISRDILRRADEVIR